METKKTDEKDFIEILKIFSPGTAIRTALNDVMKARMGALIVVDKEGLSEIMEGGFEINCNFSPQKLVELAKMDGAIILSEDMKKILYSNTLLVPDMRIKTKETGTRHKAAERTAKQLDTLVVAVSERKNKITLYCGDISYVLDESSEILRRATETLQILEKQKDIFDDLLIHLNISEITFTTTMAEVCNVLQRIEIIQRISDVIKKYLVELGKEGLIASMRLRELTKNFGKERELIIKDYNSDYVDIKSSFDEMSFDFLLDVSNIARILFKEFHDKPITPRGFRILNKTNLSEKNVTLLTDEFASLNDILDADKESLIRVLNDEGVVDLFIKNLDSIKEKILEGKNI
ncbi:MAG: DNA integrity scanning diadenylate cyclase DisA [Nanoarchaeota archaeon]|nr:DNA integrity scanning diadenylate cyclase DisA [Nanoarchaeota archaeon]